MPIATLHERPSPSQSVKKLGASATTALLRIHEKSDAGIGLSLSTVFPRASPYNRISKEFKLASEAINSLHRAGMIRFNPADLSDFRLTELGVEAAEQLEGEIAFASVHRR